MSEEEELEQRHREGYERQPVQEGEFPDWDANDADDLEDELQWDHAFDGTRVQLVAPPSGLGKK